MTTAAPASTASMAPGRVAIVLSSIGGFVDAAGFIVLLGLFTAHMSGNSTGLGVAIGAGDWSAAVKRGFVIPVFVLATAAGVAFFDAHLRRDADRSRAMASLLTAEAVLIAVFIGATLLFTRSAALEVDSAPYLLVAALATAAMGMQNATLRRVDGITVHTTFVTGMLTEAAVGFVQWHHLRKVEQQDASATSPADVAAARHEAVLASSVWMSYLVGAIVGAVLVSRVNVAVLALPIAVLAAVIVVLHRR